MRILFLALAGLCGMLNAQPEYGQFEVASIRPGSTESGRPSVDFPPGGGIRATNVTLNLLIQLAYDIRPEQLSGGPAWAGSQTYTVIAKGPGGGPVLSEAARQELALARLKALLASRFHLALERAEIPAAGYVLTVEKQGHKMTPVPSPEGRQLRQVGRWQLRAEGVEMSLLARFLGVHLHGTVVDRTGLEGRFTFHLNWTPAVPAPSALDPSAAELPEESLLPAVQEQLGLRLERRKITTDHYTIQRAEKPEEN